MNYISTKELAEKWQVSISRIVRLAKEGRIPGARLVGKSWVFLPNTSKPSDKRRKENRRTEEQRPFRFPLYLYNLYSDKEVEEDFSLDERTLYRAEQLYLQGEHIMSRNALRELLATTDDLYVRFGAQYYLCFADLHLCNYEEACRLYHDMNMQYAEDFPHKAEIGFLMHDLETYFVGNQYYLEEFSIDPRYRYPAAMRDYLLLESCFSDMLRANFKRVPLSPLPYELICQTGQQLSALSELMLHLYCAGICIGRGLVERMTYHLNEVSRIVGENHMEQELAPFVRYIPDEFIELLGNGDPAQLARIRTMAAGWNDAFRGLQEYVGRDNVFRVLDMKDYTYIMYATKGYTNKEIADILHLSVPTINKRFAALYEKTGTRSKSELVRLHKDSIMSF